MRILQKKHIRYNCLAVFNKFNDNEKREIRSEICDALYLSSLPPLYAVISGRRPVLLWEARAVEEVFSRRGIPASEVWRES